MSKLTLARVNLTMLSGVAQKRSRCASRKPLSIQRMRRLAPLTAATALPLIQNNKILA